MITTGRWVFHINNMFMKEDLTLQINLNDDGSYTFYAVTEKGLRPFPKEAADKAKVDGDSIKAVIENPESPMMKVEIVVNFEEEKAKGYFKLPILGKMKFDGEKLEMTDLPILDEMSPEEATEKFG